MPKWFHSIRSLSTLLLILTFCWVFVMGIIVEKPIISGEIFSNLISIVVGFYFGKSRPEDKGES